MPTRQDPRIARSRAVILPVATEHFITHGYVGANVDLIALEAGVSKRTVYNLYGGKEQLFTEVLEHAIGTAERFSSALTFPGGDLADELRSVATQLARTVMLGPVLGLRRLLIGEAGRFPERAADYYARAPGQVMDTLAERFGELHERGLLRTGDAVTAAEHFAFLIMGATLDRALFEGAPDPAEVDRRAIAGAEAFLRAHAADR